MISLILFCLLLFFDYPVHSFPTSCRRQIFMYSVLEAHDNETIIHLVVRYKNRPNMSFDDVGSEADQQFDLQPDHSGVLEYRTK